jgi:hypothetical protein
MTEKKLSSIKRRRKQRRNVKMNMKVLYNHVEDIESAIEKYEQKKITYQDTKALLISYGYSDKEAILILKNVKEEE